MYSTPHGSGLKAELFPKRRMLSAYANLNVQAVLHVIAEAGNIRSSGCHCLRSEGLPPARVADRA
jgi:hypothetical protein